MSAEAHLSRFAALLREVAVPRGLVAESDLERLYERHIEDSLRAVQVFSDEDHLAYDLGSGAGLPGIPLAIALPRCRFVLAESRQTRAAFLELAVAELGLQNVEVHAGRVENLSRGADVCTARAFAPLERAWPTAASLLRPAGRLIYFAGQGLDDPELAAREAPGADRDVRIILASGSPLVIMERK